MNTLEENIRPVLPYTSTAASCNKCVDVHHITDSAADLALLRSSFNSDRTAARVDDDCGIAGTIMQNADVHNSNIVYMHPSTYAEKTGVVEGLAKVSVDCFLFLVGNSCTRAGGCRGFPCVGVGGSCR